MALADENETYDMPLANAASAVHEAQRFLKVVWYRKNTVVVVGVVVALIGVWYAATATRYYKSTASILLVQNGMDQANSSLGGNRSGQYMMPQPIPRVANTQQKTIRDNL
ncbi:MAG: Wzz/FepE/Etk N-terminal domain-containing protein, partial [Pirellulaceae bacterium]|nr:Wzz/FepE/Etk N-terminal domain-containing protein [Pirellulaceae bacterium]